MTVDRRRDSKALGILNLQTTFFISTLHRVQRRRISEDIPDWVGGWVRTRAGMNEIVKPGQALRVPGG